MSAVSPPPRKVDFSRSMQTPLTPRRRFVPTPVKKVDFTDGSEKQNQRARVRLEPGLEEAGTSRVGVKVEEELELAL